jgi:uncharacterized protein (TIGR02391 family)
MLDPLAWLERVARQAHQHSHVERTSTAVVEHPFVARDIYDGFPPKVRKLFDDGHYAEATFAAYKYLDQTVQRASKLSKSGEALMMEAFKEDGPRIPLTPCGTITEKDEQRGYRFLFAGAAVGIRNPRGHEAVVADDLETCLSHLGFATMLLRRLDRAENGGKKEPGEVAQTVAGQSGGVRRKEDRK